MFSIGLSHSVSLCGGVQVLADTLSPAWCETLLFDRVLLEGATEELQQDPPLIIINFFSYNNMVTIHILLLLIHSFKQMLFFQCNSTQS